MAQDATETVIAKGAAINFGLVGVNLPDDDDPRDTLDNDFNEAGFVTEDGITFGVEVDLLEIMAMQSARPIRREANTRNYSLGFGLEQWNAPNLTLAFGGGRAITTAAGVVRYDFPTDEDALDELSMVADWEDSGYTYRLVYPSGNVTEGVDVNLVRTGPAILAVAFRALAEAPYLVTDDPAFSPIS